MNGQGREHDKQHFPLSSGERVKFINLTYPHVLFSFIAHNMGTGAKGDWDFRISDLVKNPDGTDI